VNDKTLNIEIFFSVSLSVLVKRLKSGQRLLMPNSHLRFESLMIQDMRPRLRKPGQQPP